MVAEQRLRSGFTVNHRATPPDFFKKNVYKFNFVFLPFVVAIMSTHRDETHGIPEFSGDVAAYRDWKRQVQIKHAGAKYEVRARIREAEAKPRGVHGSVDFSKIPEISRLAGAPLIRGNARTWQSS